ncbi:uncharacterized protein [Fopius arisanus]|uniref:Uncharacterized protein n=1 Tax=Fopius arisanus TaxID=64838 RepID=A0A9R1TYH1_9HYME|nr:PREDICTED: uncharacterized protein LOC105266219 [Fopius arisanus]
MLCRGKTQTTACQSVNGAIGFASRYDVEWLEPDVIDAEVSRLVNGGTASGRNPRRWRSSTSSGYSSHSPPLSAGSYSTCCASVLRSSGTIGDVGLAVIHEAEIPRPIWPSLGNRDCNFEGHEESLCKYCGYTRICPRSNKCRTTCRDSTAPGGSARDVLLELSRTLTSVIDGASVMTAEEVLRDISKTVAQGIQGIQRSSGEEHVYRHSSTLSSGVGKDSVNPVNWRLYGRTWTTNPGGITSSQGNPEGKTLPALFLVPRCHGICPGGIVRCAGKSAKDGGNPTPRKDENKRKRAPSRMEGNTVKGCYPSNEPVYSTLDPSDESSAYGAVGDPPRKSPWNQEITVCNKHLDFTLDGARAERLGRTIARAKRRRQWCRALTALFGLVFFILSVIVVSMSVTKGRKIFGSM